MGAAAVRSQQGGTHVFMFSSVPNQQGNANQFTSNAHPRNCSPDMACEACNVNFNLFKRKKMCRECERYFCSKCVHRLALKGGNKETFRQCKKCRMLLTGSFTRQELIKWKVKDLKCLLLKRNISTDGCKEKQELIDLIVINFGHMTNSDEVEERSDTESVLSIDTQSQMPRQPQPTTSIPRNDSVPGQMPASPRQETDEERAARLRQRQLEELRQSEFLNALNPDQTKNKQESATVPNKRLNLSDIATVEDIDNLTVKEMKELLFRGFVDYKGCVEKEELKGKLVRLWKEHKDNTEKVKKLTEETDTGASESNGKSIEDEICKICMDAMVDCVLLECGHMVSCTDCGKRLAECPICRQYVVRVVRTFRS